MGLKAVLIRGYTELKPLWGSITPESSLNGGFT